MLSLQDESTGEITFYMKGADVVMAGIVQYNDWLEEEVWEGCSCFSPPGKAWHCSRGDLTAKIAASQKVTDLGKSLD